MRFETLAIRTQTERTREREHSTPLFLTSSFVFEDAEQARSLFAAEAEGNIYSRFTNPNNREFENKICLMEGTEDAFATASGMSAVFASIAPFVVAGDHIVASKSIFGNSFKIFSEILPKWGIDTTFVDVKKPNTWIEAIQSNTRMIFVETPTNPALDLIDLEFLGKLTKAKNIFLNVDNCFATPYLQNPKKFGADLITHSGTKFIDGQGRVLGGVVTGCKELIKEVRNFSKRTGPALSPFNAWILSKSLETLAVRMDRHCENAAKIADYLDQHPMVKHIAYPFHHSHPDLAIAQKQMKKGGGLVSFIISGGLSAGIKFLNALKICSITANLGDTRTIVTHPSSTTHSKVPEKERKEVGVEDGLIRISAGLEHIDDIIDDLATAFKVANS